MIIYIQLQNIKWCFAKQNIEEYNTSDEFIDKTVIVEVLNFKIENIGSVNRDNDTKDIIFQNMNKVINELIMVFNLKHFEKHIFQFNR